jgi:hypothetical protein
MVIWSPGRSASRKSFMTCSFHIRRPPQRGLDGERDYTRAARGQIVIRGDTERNKICRRQFCLPLWAEDRLT